MSKRKLSDILVDALADRLAPNQQSELRNAVATLEVGAQSTGDVVMGSRHISRISVGNLVIGASEGLRIVNPEGGALTVSLEPNGSAMFGSNLSDVGKTSLFISSTAQKYNGEILGDGDVLFGDSSTGKANLLWDRSDGRLKFRGGKTVNAYIDTDGTLVATGANISGTITAAAGAIGGWSISASRLTSGSGANTVGLDSSGSHPAIFAGNATPANAPFRVTQAGALTSTSGLIGGWTISATQIVKTGIIIDSALDQIIVGASAPRLVLDGANRRIRTSTFASGAQGFSLDGATGNAEFANIIARGEIRTSVFAYGMIMATAGSHGVYPSAGKLRADVTTVAGPTTFTIDVEDPPIAHVALFAENSILRIKDGVADNWMTVQVGGVSNQSTFYRYTCVLNSGTPTIFRAGAAVIGYGANTGGGYLAMSADGTIGSAPNLSILTHAGSPWTTQTIRARLGNLNGSYGVAANHYGLGVGDYASGNYMRYDPDASPSFSIRAGGGAFNVNNNGVYFVGSGATSGVRQIVFYHDNGGSYVPMGGTYGDWGGSGPAIQWLKSQVSTGYPWSEAQTIIEAYDGAGLDARLVLSSLGTLTTNSVSVVDFSVSEVRAGRVIASFSSSLGDAGIGEDPIFANYAGFWNASQTRVGGNFCLLQYYDGTSYLNSAQNKTTHLQINNADVITITPSLINLKATGVLCDGDVYTEAWTDYSSTSTVTGWSSFTIQSIYYKKVGKLVYVKFDLRGTSNATGASFTLPFTSSNTVATAVPARIRDNGTYAVGQAVLAINASTVNGYATIAAGSWTNSGTKELTGEFWYETS